MNGNHERHERHERIPWSIALFVLFVSFVVNNLISGKLDVEDLDIDTGLTKGLLAEVKP